MLKSLIIVAVLSIAGTQTAAQSLVGKWDCDGRVDKTTSIKSLQQYRSNGNFYHLVNVAIGQSGERFDAAVAMRGIWTGKGAVLIEDIKSARIRSVKRNGRDITKTPEGQFLAKTLRSSMIRPGRPSRITLDTLSANKMTFKDGRVAANCTRR